jgi:DNA replication protein DnaC
LAQALAHQACLKGYDTVYVNTATLLTSLALATLKGTYARKLKRLVRLPVLVLDDFGLKPLRNTYSEVFYDVIAVRYESGSTIITSNHALDEWPTLFGDPLLASSGLDRLFHNAYVITITGASFRARNRHLASAVDSSTKVTKTAGPGSKEVTA